METFIITFFLWPLVHLVVAILAYYKPDVFNYQGYYPPNDIRRYMRRNGINFSSWMDLTPDEWDYALKIAPKIFIFSSILLFSINTMLVCLIKQTSTAEPILLLFGGITFWISCDKMYRKAKNMS